MTMRWLSSHAGGTQSRQSTSDVTSLLRTSRTPLSRTLGSRCTPMGGPSDDLHRLAEALTRVADLWKQWRHRHLVTVARVIGQKPGTGGTSGVDWLRRVSELEICPELWTMRTRL